MEVKQKILDTNAQNTNNEEIEVKIKVADDATEMITAWLQKNAEFKYKVTQEEYYLDNPNSSWFRRHQSGYRYALQYLRVRFTKNGDSVCFKDWETGDMPGAAGLFCKDIEYKVNCGKQALALFKSLGFTDVTKFYKLRETYICQDIEISIDTVEGLGCFIEFEIKVRQHEDQNHEYNRLISFIETDLGITCYKIQKQGFIVLLWNTDFEFN